MFFRQLRSASCGRAELKSSGPTKARSSWFPLTKVQFPGFADYFNKTAPAEVKDFSPSFLSAFKEPGVVQIWSGLIARTIPEWSLLVRSPVNLARSQGYENYEGIIETDRWFGPLFTNVRLTRTYVPVEFNEEYPFIQVQPVPRSAYGRNLDFLRSHSRSRPTVTRRLGGLSNDRSTTERRPTSATRSVCG